MSTFYGLDIIRALVGLAGACQSGTVTADTYGVIIDALNSIYAGGMDEIVTVAGIHKEKYRVSPGCETCAMPCGNTSDCDAGMLTSDTDEAIAKRALIHTLAQTAHAVKKRGTTVTAEEADMFIRALFYIGYDINADVINAIANEIKNLTGAQS